MIHALLSRIVWSSGKPPRAPQPLALAAVLIGNFELLSLGWFLVFNKPDMSFWGILSAAAYVLLTYNSLAFCYVNFLNASETSLHIHILMILLQEGQVAVDELNRRYGARELVDARIDRMIALGQLQKAGDYYLLTNRTLVRAGRVIAGWRSVLKLPQAPRGTGRVQENCSSAT